MAVSTLPGREVGVAAGGKGCDQLRCFCEAVALEAVAEAGQGR